MIKRFASIAALAGSPGVRQGGFGFSSAQYDGESLEQAIAYTRHGNTALVAEAERLIARFSGAVEIPERSWQPDVCGAYPVVPEYLAGHPDCMRRRVTAPGERSPLNIYVCVAANAAVSGEQMRRRGTAILALVLAISRVRPITLQVLDIGATRNPGEIDSVPVASVNTTPLELATAAYVLTSAGFFRHVMMGAGRDIPGGKPESFPQGWRELGYYAGLVRRLGGNPEIDLMIPAADARDRLLADPVAWVRAQVARFLGETE